MLTPEEIADELLSKWDAGYDQKTNLMDMITKAIREERARAEELAKVLKEVLVLNKSDVFGGMNLSNQIEIIARQALAQFRKGGAG